MALFTINGEKLGQIKSNPFNNEKEIQTLTENNLKTVFGLEFIKSEFALKNFRLDTLAFDKTTNSFVVIEFKKDKNFSVVDQGYAYLSLLLNNKADFILEYNENSDESLKKKDIDWSQSRVIFISPNFTTYQKEAINLKDLPIELWEIKRFSNDTVAYNRLKPSATTESIKTISKGVATIDTVNKDIKVYTKEDLLNALTPRIKEIINFIHKEVYEIDEGIEEKVSRNMINYYSGGNGIVWIKLRGKANYISVYFKEGQYIDKYEKLEYSDRKGGIFANPQLKLNEDELQDDLDNKYERYLRVL